MNVIEFGRRLISSGDLDPIYIMLHKAALPVEQLERWCVAYWMFYHAGVASWLSEETGSEFWKCATACLPKAPRGTERRHFRGAAAIKAITGLERRYPAPEAFPAYTLGIPQPTPRRFFKRFLKENPVAFKGVTERVLEHTGFGPWIAFKIVDMLEAVLGYPVSSEGADLNMYEEPRRGAALVSQQLGLDNSADAVRYLLLEFQDVKAPPSYRRMVGVMEVETILCKYKAHIAGYYPVGKDTREIHHALYHWPSATGARLAEFLPKVKAVNSLI